MKSLSSIFGHLILLWLCSCEYFDTESEENTGNIVEKALRTQTALLEDHQLVSRQLATHIYKYQSYGTITMKFFPMMTDVTEAIFTFQSEDVQPHGVFGKCLTKTIFVHIKNGAYPAVNPDGYNFPKGFVSPSTREHNIHTLELLSDRKNISYLVNNPKPGNWYAIIYIKWEDPRKPDINPRGLLTDCQTTVYTDLQVKQEENIKIVDCYAGITIDCTNLPALFKCMSLDSAEVISLKVNVIQMIKDNRELCVGVDALAIPTESSNILYCSFEPQFNKELIITFSPYPLTWHYIYVKELEDVSKLEDCKSYARTDEFDEFSNHTISDLTREDKGRLFAFDFAACSGSLLRTSLNSSKMMLFRFQLNNFLDIGGSLSIAANLLLNENYYTDYEEEFQKTSLLVTPESRRFRTVICLNIGHPSVPLQNGLCKFNKKLKPALFILNNTSSDFTNDKSIIPYPDSGKWYLTSRAFCDNVIFKTNETTYDFQPFDEQQVTGMIPCVSNDTAYSSECKASVALRVASRSCVNGTCSKRGICELRSSGTMVMSFCRCPAGLGGWDCSDATRSKSRSQMVISVVFLIISNLFFGIPISVGIVRRYYVEATMYTWTMIFSMFYHACDAPMEVRFCIVKLNSLQFGDFYCAYMAFWITMLAMSIINVILKSCLQLMGGILISVLIAWDKHSFVVFAIPITIGTVILFTSWGLNYIEKEKWKYEKKYYFIYLPIGLSLGLLGSTCFIFLQNDQNYYITHSLWHIIVAVSSAVLLPLKKEPDDLTPFTSTR